MQSPEQKLWQAVVFQAVKDARKKQLKNDYTNAINWILSDCQDFRLVCELAGFDHKIIKKGVFKNFLTKKEMKNGK